MKELTIAKRELEDLSNFNVDTNTSNVTLDDAALEEAERKESQFEAAQLKVGHLRKSVKALKGSLAAQMHTQEKAIMTVRIWHDLSIVDALSDPRELLDQQVYLWDRLKSKPSEQMEEN
jgi:hypothetical protein